MAIAAWKRLEKTPGYQKKKRFLKRLIGKELKLNNDIEVPVIKDGGWWFTPEASLPIASFIRSASVTTSISICPL